MNRYDLPEPRYTGTLVLWLPACACFPGGFLPLGIIMVLGAVQADVNTETGDWLGRAMVGAWGASLILLVLGHRVSRVSRVKTLLTLTILCEADLFQDLRCGSRAT